MSNYRCPLCGANHKSEADHCRLCGQSMKPGAVAIERQAVAQSVRAPRGNKGIVLIGLGLVVAVVVGAIVMLGLGDDSKQIRQAKDVLATTSDGWTSRIEEQGGFRLELPGVHTRAAAPFAGTDDGTVTAWQAPIGNDTELLAGWGTAAPPLTDGPITPPKATRFLRDTVLPRWAVANGLDATDARISEFNLAGIPAVSVAPTRNTLKVKGQDAYAQIVLALRGTRLYVLQVLSIYKDAPQLARMTNTFVLT